MRYIWHYIGRPLLEDRVNLEAKSRELELSVRQDY